MFAGVVGAASNNGIGVAGVVQRPGLLICRFMDATGSGSLSDAALCFDWCIQQQADVISCSFGGTTFSQTLQAAVQAASMQNVFVATSAGNNGANSDGVKQYPSAFAQTMPGVIAVAASDTNDNLWPRSNYGPASVQVAAPGVSVLGLGLGGITILDSGTSMSGRPPLTRHQKNSPPLVRSPEHAFLIHIRCTPVCRKASAIDR